MSDQNKFDIEVQYQDYLKRINLPESKMNPIQKQQLKKTFYAACGKMLNLLEFELTKLTEEEAIEKLKHMAKQINIFFKKSQN